MSYLCNISQSLYISGEIFNTTAPISPIPVIRFIVKLVPPAIGPRSGYTCILPGFIAVGIVTAVTAVKYVRCVKGELTCQ